jgi:hypothetical protein
MVYIPDISNYQPFYIMTDADTAAIDLKSQWGIIVKSNPDAALPKAKEPYKNEWLDEDGDDEYNKEMHYEAMEISIGIYLSCKGATQPESEAELRQVKREFFNKIRNGEFKIYDSALQNGYRKVRYVSEKIERKIWHNAPRYTEISTITLKVNDPITQIKLANNQLVEA